jgi:hypothetical protein
MSAGVERVPAGRDERTDSGLQPAAPGDGSRKRGGRRAGGRGRFWAGFVVGFALLTIASCTGVAATLGFGRLSLADLRGGESGWVPPTLVPTPEAPLGSDGVVAEGSLVAGGRFEAGSRARNITGTRVNVRSTPGHLGKPEGDVLAQVSPGEQVEILGETATADNLTWYRVLFQGSEGWVAEATASGVQILGE